MSRVGARNGRRIRTGSTLPSGVHRRDLKVLASRADLLLHQDAGPVAFLLQPSIRYSSVAVCNSAAASMGSALLAKCSNDSPTALWSRLMSSNLPRRR